MENFTIGVLLFLAGAFSTYCAAMDYDWYMDSRKARFLVTLVGRPMARLFYMVLGIVVMVAGILGGLGFFAS